MTILGYFELKHDLARRGAADLAKSAPVGTCVTFTDKKRTLSQNDKLHPMVRDIDGQILWPINGTPTRLGETQWRYFFAAHIRKGAQLVPSIDGDGFIALGVGTSGLSAREASDLIELMYAFGSDRGVKWSEKSKEHYEKYRPRSRAA